MSDSPEGGARLAVSDAERMELLVCQAECFTVPTLYGATTILAAIRREMETLAPKMDDGQTVASWSAAIHLVYRAVNNEMNDLERALEFRTLKRTPAVHAGAEAAQ